MLPNMWADVGKFLKKGGGAILGGLKGLLGSFGKTAKDWSGVIAPWLPGVLGMFGGDRTNRQNQANAREQMAFQERMSSTAAQRARADFEAAGLNPALAYGTTASSPSGSSSTAEDSLGKGLSSAMAIQGMRQQLEQSRATVGATRAQQKQTEAQTKETERNTRFMRTLEPSTRREAIANMMAIEFENEGRKNEANLNKKMGIWRPIVGEVTGSAKGLVNIMAGIRGGGARAAAARKGPLNHINQNQYEKY